MSRKRVMPTTKTTSVSTKNDVSAQYTSCINALTANYPATQTWTINNTPYKRGDLVNLLQEGVQAIQTTKTDHDTWTASVQAEKATRAQITPVLNGLHKALEVELGADNPAIVQYGFPPAQPRVQSASSKAVAAAKAKATRAAKKAALAALKAPAASAPAPAATPAPAAAPVPPKTA